MTASDLRDQIFTLLYSKKKPEEAILQLNRVIKQTPENSQALALKAYALNRLANARREWEYSQRALEYADRALALNPDEDVALTSKGWALIDLGKPQEAIPVLSRATNINPANEYAWYNLSWAQYLTGNALASAESIKIALQISPGNVIIKHGKEMMGSGNLPKHLKRIAASPGSK